MATDAGTKNKKEGYPVANYAGFGYLEPNEEE